MCVCVCELTGAQTRSPLQLNVLLVVLHHLLPLPHFFGPVGSIVRQSDVHSLCTCNDTRLISTVNLRQTQRNKAVGEPFFPLTMLRISFFHVAPVGPPPDGFVLHLLSLFEVTSVAAILF